MNGETNKRSFRSWYERQLLESFAWLGVCVLCAFVFGAVYELIGLKTPGLTPLITLGILYVVGLFGLNAWRQFRRQLTRAQYCANHATCSECNGYGLFDVIANHTPQTISAACRRCGHRWIINPSADSKIE